jgi:Bifunctional DNA primase/polymerase, N-terminal
MMSDALAWALAYAAHGLLLLPVKADKTPLTPHGLRDASGDPAVIEGWGRRWPFADWGWALAAAVVAIDIDVKPGRNGYQDFRHLQGCDPRDVMTPSTSTPAGGMHLFYAAAKPYRNRVAIEGTAIDVRAEGGYVVLPGHKNGRRWVNKLRTTPLASAPAWLDIALKETLPASGFRCLPSSSSAPLEREQALATLKRACARVIAAPEGAQEHIRHRECFNIGGMIGRGDLDYATAFTALVAAACAMPTYRDPWRNLDERVARSIEAGMVRLLFS